MLSEREAARLADQAGSRDKDGTRSLAGQWAWRDLTAAGDHGDRNAAEAVLRAWLNEPDEERWQALARWREPGRLAEAVFAAATDPARPAAARAALGTFCTGHGLAPDDEARRVLFLVLTGQARQQHALDPDGALFAAAYHQARTPTRLALLEALASAGELDLIRVVAGPGEPATIAQLGPDERAYLVRQLAEGGNWARLWALACTAPLAEAAAAARLFPDGQPGEAGARWLLRRLAAAPPPVIQAATGRLQTVAVTRLMVPESIICGSFAADGSRVVTCSSFGPGFNVQACVFDRPSGRWAGGFYTGDLQHGAVLDLGRGTVIVENRTGSYRLSGLYAGRPVFLFHRAERFRPDEYDYPFRPLVRLRDGFVTSADGTALLTGTPPAETIGRLTPGDLGLPWADCWPLASDRGRGRLAVRGGGEIAVLDELGVIARAPDPDQAGTNEAAFAGPGRLVTSSTERLTSWRLDGRTLVPEATTDGWFSHLTALPSHGHVAALGPRHDTEPKFRLTLFDAGNLSVSDNSPGPQGRRATCVWASPGGNLLAAGYHGGTVLVCDPVFRLAAGVASRPIAAMRPGDLAAVAAAEDRDADPEIRDLLSLLRACLYYRFGTEVAVTPGERTAPGTADDIALADGGR